MKQQLRVTAGVELGWADYMLLFVAIFLASFSVGFGLGVPQIGYYFIAITAVGTIFSYFMRSISASYWWLDGVLYLFGAIFAAISNADLNALLPSDGFPPQLRVAGWLCWMMAFGSFFTWRDSTVLFQAVPSIAIFGLVGTWDTFKNAPYLFFAFLLCYSTLFSRSHGRVMMRLASESGFRPSENAKSDKLWALLKRGPWRWMAGPEWALGSAASVVVISLIAAPFLQWSTGGVARLVNVPTPPRPNTPLQRSSAINLSSSEVAEPIGRGPQTLTKTPVFAIKMDRPRYLRVRTYDTYFGHGWYPVPAVDTATINRMKADPESLLYKSQNEARDFDNVPFYIEYLGRQERNVPLPGELISVNEEKQFMLRPDGTLRPISDALLNAIVDGSVKVPSKNVVPSVADTSLAPVYSNAEGKTPIPKRVADLAVEVTKNSKTDIEKANAIQQAVTDRITYTLNPDATPEQKDPVDFALFESKKGYCDVFASSVVLMARAVHLPARYVTGYYPFEEDGNRPGYYTLHESEAHAWAEIFFKDVGWVTFDATDGAHFVPGEERGSPNDTSAWYSRTWVKVVGGGLLALLGIGGIWLLVGSYLRSTPKVANKQRSEATKTYVDLLRTLQKSTGKPHRPSQTPFEYLAAVHPFLNGAYEPSRLATQKFVEVYYGTEDPPPSDVFELKKLVEEAKAALKHVKPPKNASPTIDS